MELKDKKYFYFTQNSLNTFKNCPFKFKKKYIDNIKWQEEDSGLNLEHIELGTDFHKIAERYFMKIPTYEESFRDNEVLFLAYKNLVNKFPLNLKFNYYPEYSIRYSDKDIRLQANIDLIIIKENSIEIWDWKTNANTNSKKYIESLQTKIYMMVVKKCCKNIFGRDFSEIKMTYFSPENNLEIGSITYSDEKYKKDEKYICNLIEKIYNFNWDEFNRDKFKSQCKFCEFNLFCNTVKPDMKTEFAVLDWNDIEEIC